MHLNMSLILMIISIGLGLIRWISDIFNLRALLVTYIITDLITIKISMTELKKK